MDDSKPSAALDESQRPHEYRYMANVFYHEQYDKEANAAGGASESAANANGEHHRKPEDKSRAQEPEGSVYSSSDAPSTTVSTFMARMDIAEKQHKRAADKNNALKLVPETIEETMPTDRAFIEARKEERLLAVMANGQRTPSRFTPSEVTDDDSPPIVNRVHFAKQPVKEERKVSMPTTTKSSSNKSFSTKVGLKKPLALPFNMPNFKSSTNNNGPPTPIEPDNVPSKAAQVLGTTGSSKWPMRRKHQHVRSNSARSLSRKVDSVSETDVTALPPLPTSSSADSKNGMALQPQETRAASGNFNISRIPRKAVSQSFPREVSASSLAPTPPAKDTPPHVKVTGMEVAGKTEARLSGLGISGHGDDEDSDGIDYQKDTAELKEERFGPEWVKHTASDYARLVETAPSMYSMRASVLGSPLPPSGRGLLPPTAYATAEYSPSLYSQPSERATSARFGKPAPALHARLDDSPSARSSADPVKRNHRTSGWSPLSPSDALVYPVPCDRQPDVDDESLDSMIHSFPLPPRSSSLDWRAQRVPLLPPPPFVLPSTSLQNPPVTTSERVADLDSTTVMSSNMRNDSGRPSYESAADDKASADEAAAVTNGEPHSDAKLNGTAPSGSERQHPRSIGLTPLLAQQLGDNTNPMSPAFNYPSAMPSPLRGPFPMPQFTPPPGGLSQDELLTHFHVIHYHLDDAMRMFQEHGKKFQDEVTGDNEDRFNKLRNALDEYFGDVRAHLNAIEHNVGRTTGELEAVKTAIDAHKRNVDEHVMKPMKKLINQNTELAKKVDALQELIHKLERKIDDNKANPPAYASSGDNGSGQPSGPGRSVHDGPPGSFARWGGYDGPRHMVPGQQQDRQTPYTEIGNRYYNNPDPAQHQTYQDGYYGNGSSYGFMRRH